jgi:hypothetical protein
MPRRSSTAKPKPKPKREGTPHDFTLTARRVVEQAIGETLKGEPLPDPDAGKNPAAVALGKLGGAKGGQGQSRSPKPCQAEGNCEEGRWCSMGEASMRGSSIRTYVAPSRSLGFSFLVPPAGPPPSAHRRDRGCNRQLRCSGLPIPGLSNPWACRCSRKTRPGTSSPKPPTPCERRAPITAQAHPVVGLPGTRSLRPPGR